jgi:hypothetical protein
MSNETTTIDYLLTLNADMSYTELRKLEISLIRIMRLVQRFSGNENLNQAITGIEKMIMTLRILQMAIRATENAEGPLGWLFAAVSWATAATTILTETTTVM